MSNKLTEFIRTDHERLLEIGLKALGINYHVGECYCFKCDNTFTWHRSEPPELCMWGLHKWTEPGQFARPDFLIYHDKDDEKPIAVIRVDGPIHDKRKQKQKDKFQTKAFLDHGIKVFLVRNEQLLGAEHRITKKAKSTWFPVRFPEWQYTSITSFIISAINDDTLYQKYLKDKDVKHYLGV